MTGIVITREVERLPLTDRELQVLGLVAAGLQSGDIAEHLLLSPETVRSHVHNAKRKLGARTRAQAVAIALGTGQLHWTMPPEHDGFAEPSARGPG